MPGDGQDAAGTRPTAPPSLDTAPVRPQHAERGPTSSGRGERGGQDDVERRCPIGAARAPDRGRACGAGKGGALGGAAHQPRRLVPTAGPSRPTRAAHRARRSRGCPSWCPSATAGWRRRRSPSTAVPPTSWRPTSRPCRALGVARAALRRRAPVELRRLRVARARPRVRRQRLRRDAPRPLRVGRQAARRRASRSPAAAAGSAASGAARSCATRSRSYREAMRSFAEHARTSTSGTPASTRADLDARWGQELGKKALPSSFAARPSPRPSRKDRLQGRVQAHPAGRRRAAVRQRPAPAGAGRGAVRRAPIGALIERAASEAPCAPTGAASSPTGGTCSRATGSCSWPGRWSAWAASAPAAGSALLVGPRRRRPAVPAGEGGGGVGARAAPGRQRAARTTANAWSRVSG